MQIVQALLDWDHSSVILYQEYHAFLGWHFFNPTMELKVLLLPLDCSTHEWCTQQYRNTLSSKIKTELTTFSKNVGYNSEHINRKTQAVPVTNIKTEPSEGNNVNLGVIHFKVEPEDDGNHQNLTSCKSLSGSRGNETSTKIIHTKLYTCISELKISWYMKDI